MDASNVTALIEGYVGAWSEHDPEVRKKLLETVWNVNGTYTDPLSVATNRDQLDAIIGHFLKTNRGAKFTLKGNVDTHHDHIRFYWIAHLTNGAELPGMDYGEIGVDGKLLKIVGFF